MSPKEYKAMVNDFDKALLKKCKDEGVPYRKLGIQGDSHYYQLGHETYVLHHNGERPRWNYMGNGF